MGGYGKPLRPSLAPVTAMIVPFREESLFYHFTGSSPGLEYFKPERTRLMSKSGVRLPLGNAAPKSPLLLTLSINIDRMDKK